MTWFKLVDVVKRFLKLTRILGMLAVAAGCFWLWLLAVLPAIGWVRDLGVGADSVPAEESELGIYEQVIEVIGWLLAAVFYLFGLGIGGMLIYWGIRLLKDPPLPRPLSGEGWSTVDVQRAQIATDPVVSDVRYVSGFLAFFAVLWISAEIEMIVGVEAVPSPLWGLLRIIISIVVIAPVYVVVVRLSLRSRGYRRVELCYVIAKPLIALLACTIWMALSNLVEWRWPERLESNLVHDAGPMETLLSCGFAFGPIIVAVLCYRFAVRRLGYREMELDLRRLGVRGGEGKK